MLVQSDRFGSLEIPENKIITMKKPILGFEKLTRFCLVEKEEFLPFLWLQAIEDPHLAFIVVNPTVFFADYGIRVHSKEVADLGVQSPENVEVYVVVTVPENPAEMSVNLQGPILINSENNLGKQLVLVNSEYCVHHPLLEEMETMSRPEKVKVEEPAGV